MNDQAFTLRQLLLHQHQQQQLPSRCVVIMGNVPRFGFSLAEHLKPKHLSVDCCFVQIPIGEWPILLRLNNAHDVIWFAEPNIDVMHSMIQGVNTSTGVDANIRHHVIVTHVHDHDEGFCVFNSLLQKFSSRSVGCVEYAGWLPTRSGNLQSAPKISNNFNWPEFTTSHCVRLLEKVLARLPIAT